MKLYIAGPITGVRNYKWRFGAAAEADLHALGHVVLNPAVLPFGLTQAEYMRVCLAMIDCADAALLLPGWEDSAGARLEADYCRKTGRPVVLYPLDRNELARHLMLDTVLTRGGANHG